MTEVNENSSRDSLILEYQEYVHFVVGKLISSLRLPKNQFDEYVASGYLGLVEAAERFDPSQGTSFKNYAFLRIRGAIIDNIRRSADVSGRGYRYIKTFEAIQFLREEEVYREASAKPVEKPSSKEVIAKAIEIATKGALAFRVSISVDEIEEIEEYENEDNPEQVLELKQTNQKILDFIATLPEKERIVIEEYYFNDMSFNEIAGKHEGMSKSWVSRLHSQGLSKIQENLFTVQT
ncbi:MAG: sigma-70 family RNA polymerase sigma factor [Bdellovibrionota bacterium]